MKKWLIFSMVLMFVLLVAMPLSQANEDGDSASLKKELQQMKAGMEKLMARLAVLEGLKPSFAAFMPEFSERFHIMHQAGDAEDWAVAAHELEEMKRLVKTAKLIDPVKGQLIQAFMGPQLEKIEGTIEQGDRKSFRSVLENTVKSCNTCHIAAGSPFIKVALDAKQFLTMRHSHLLKKSKVTKGHGH